MNKKSVLAYVLSFAMCLFLAMAAAGSGCYFGFLSDDSLMMAFSESESYDAIREDILEGVDYSDAPYGFDRHAAENILTKDLVRGDLSSYIYSKYSGEEFEPEEEGFENNYYFGIGGMYSEKNIIINADGEKSIDAYLPKLKEYYYGQLANVNLDSFMWAKDSYTMLITTAMIVGFVGVIICFVAIVLAEKNMRNRVQLFSFACISGGVISMAVPTYLLASQLYLNLRLPELMYNLYVTFIRNGLININFCGGFILICGIICAAADIIFLNSEKES